MGAGLTVTCNGPCDAALNATTIALCQALFDCTPFRSTKAAIKRHTLLELRGVIPALIGAEPACAGDITCTPAYVEIEATYLVPARSAISDIDAVDRPAVRITSTARVAHSSGNGKIP